MFPDVELIRSVQNELDDVIQDGIINIVQLLRSVIALNHAEKIVSLHLV